MTLNDFARLKAYWFNPAKTKIEFRLRDVRRFTTHWHQEDILARLKAAKDLLDRKQGSI